MAGTSKTSTSKARSTKGPKTAQAPKRVEKSSVMLDEDAQMDTLDDDNTEADAMDIDDDGDAALQQLLNAYKNQASKTSGGGKAVQTKANALYADTRSRVASLKTEFDSAIQEIRTNLEDLRQREQPLPISEIAIMIGQRNKNQLKAVLEDYQNYPEVSQQSAGEINSFSGGVRRQKKARTKMFRQSMTDSQDLVTRALEQHKLAADSAVLVKNLLDVMKGGK